MKIPAVLFVCLLCGPALAGGYPVSGKWGESSSSAKGPIDCSGRRVIEFNGEQRSDSGGGVPGYRNKSVTEVGTSDYRVVDYFTTGQIRNGTASYTLHKVDDDHIVLNMQRGGQLKLQKCK